MPRRWLCLLFLLSVSACFSQAFSQSPFPNGSFLHLVVFRDGEVREVALTIARAANLNLLVDSSVSGTVTVHLKKVTAEQALELLAQAVGARLLKTEAGFLLTKQPSQPFPQVDVRDGKVFVSATNSEASDLLRQIAEKGKVSLVLSADLPVVRVTVSLQGVSIEEALKVVTEAAGWEGKKEGEVFTVRRLGVSPMPSPPSLPRQPVQQPTLPKETQPSPAFPLESQPPLSSSPSPPLPTPSTMAEKEPFSQLRPFVTLLAQDAPLSQVLDEIARQAGIDLLMVGKAEEKVTVRLEKTPVEEALRLVLAGTKYSIVRLNPDREANPKQPKGNPEEGKGKSTGDGERERRSEGERERPRFLIGEWGDPTKWVSPTLAAFLETKRLPLRYLKAEQVPQLLSPAVPRDIVKVLVDQNALLITGPVELVERVEREVQTADQPAAQVAIETQVWEISQRAARQLAISFGGQKGTAKGEFGTATFPGLLMVLEEGTKLQGKFFSQLQALVEKGEARTLANPKVVSVSGKKASIQVVQELYFRTAPFTGVPQQQQPFPIVPFFQLQAVSAGVMLELTPQIGADGDILLEITPEVSSVIGVTAEGLPQLATRKATATVWVREGQTVILGGLRQREETKATVKTPVLSEIPLLGELFKSSRKEVRESELVILLTPTLVKPSPQG